MDLDPGYWIWAWEDTFFWPQSEALLGEGRSAYFQCQSGILLYRSDPLIFGAKMVPCSGGQIQVLETHLQDPVI